MVTPVSFIVYVGLVIMREWGFGDFGRFRGIGVAGDLGGLIEEIIIVVGSHFNRYSNLSR